MDSMAAFAMGNANRGKTMMIFDWDKAATIIRDRGAANAEAGLDGDWEWTGGEILREGRPLSRDESYTYLASTWATPQLCIDGEFIDCYFLNDGRGWTADTSWPASAIAILNGASEVK